jgi:hypothetical protein
MIFDIFVCYMGILGHAGSCFMSLYHIHYVYTVPGTLHHSEGSGK